MWKRRLAFKESITFLRERAEYGARRARGFFGLVPRDNRTTGDRAYVVELRNFGVQVSKALAKKLQNTDEVAAMMLVIALEAAHKSVMTVCGILSSWSLQYILNRLVHGGAGLFHRPPS